MEPEEVTDWNDVAEPGVYLVNRDTRGNGQLNYPPGSGKWGVLVVSGGQSTDRFIMQEFVDTSLSGKYIRLYAGGFSGWLPWKRMQLIEVADQPSVSTLPFLDVIESSATLNWEVADLDEARADGVSFNMTGELRQGTHSGGLQLRTNRERTIFTLSGHFHIFGSESPKLACTKTGLILLKTDMKVNAGSGEHFSGALTYHRRSSSGYVTDVLSQYVFVGRSGTIYLGAYGDESGLVMHTVNNAYFSIKQPSVGIFLGSMDNKNLERVEGNINSFKYLKGDKYYNINSELSPLWGLPADSIGWDGSIFGCYFGFTCNNQGYMFFLSHTPRITLYIQRVNVYLGDKPSSYTGWKAISTTDTSGEITQQPEQAMHPMRQNYPHQKEVAMPKISNLPPCTEIKGSQFFKDGYQYLLTSDEKLYRRPEKSKDPSEWKLVSSDQHSVTTFFDSLSNKRTLWVEGDVRDVKYLTGKEIFCVNTSAHPAWGFPKAAITWDGKTYGFVFGFRTIVTSWLFYFCTDGNIYVTRYTNSSTWNTWRKFASTEEVEVSEAPTA